MIDIGGISKSALELGRTLLENVQFEGRDVERRLLDGVRMTDVAAPEDGGVTTADEALNEVSYKSSETRCIVDLFLSNLCLRDLPAKI